MDEDQGEAGMSKKKRKGPSRHEVIMEKPGAFELGCGMYVYPDTWSWNLWDGAHEHYFGSLKHLVPEAIEIATRKKAREDNIKTMGGMLQVMGELKRTIMDNIHNRVCDACLEGLDEATGCPSEPPRSSTDDLEAKGPVGTPDA